VALRLKAGIMERVQTVIARQRHGKDVSASTDTDETTDDAVFHVWSAPKLYSEDQHEELVGSRRLRLAVVSSK
jgi:hypothetical protein